MTVRKIGVKWVVYRDDTDIMVSMHRCRAEAEAVEAGMSAAAARAGVEAARKAVEEEEQAKARAEFIARENALAEAKAKELVAKELAEAEEKAMRLAEARAELEAEMKAQVEAGAMAADETKEVPAANDPDNAPEIPEEEIIHVTEEVIPFVPEPPQEVQDGFACPHCPFVAKNLGGLNMHVRAKHKEGGME